MKAAVVPNFEKNGVKEILANLLKLLENNNIDYIVTQKETELKKCDLIITIGGDGTIIHTAKACAKFSLPILGINAGRLGYLADINPEELEKISLIVGGDYLIEERMLLEVSIGKKTFYCLNDAVISKGSLSRMLDIDIKVDNANISYRADGLIAATPTGSTAYSMSAGGPVVDPSLELFILTPICSNSLFDRPVLFNDKSVIEISVSHAKGTEAYLTIDGEKSVKIKDGDVVHIKRADINAKLMRLHKHSFYKTLSEKMRG